MKAKKRLIDICEHKNLECTGVSNFTTDWRCKDCGECWEEDKDGKWREIIKQVDSK